VTPKLSVLVLTEDSGKESHDVISNVTRRSFQLIVPNPRTNYIDFAPPDEQAIRVIRANLWKSPRYQADRINLRRLIATKLLENEPPGFVVFHVDGDRPWSQREDSENLQAFKQIIEIPVQQLLTNYLKGDKQKAAKLMQRFFLMIPFYSIEAWLFQNSRTLRQICTEKYGGRDLELIEAWEAEPASLDEIIRPKLSICVGARHNLELAEGFPAEKTYFAGCSYTSSMEHLMECDALEAALKATWND